MAKKKTFADDADKYASDVHDFVRETRQRAAELVDQHRDLQTSAVPEADEGPVWDAFTRAPSAFGDLERALASVTATARGVSDETIGVLSARNSDDNEDDVSQGDQPAEKTQQVLADIAAKKTTVKKAAAKKST